MKKLGECINRYKLRDGVTMDKIMSEIKKRKIPYAEGGTYIHHDSYYSFWMCLCDEIEVCVALPKDLSVWNDDDYVLVLDDAFGQPYTPFYGDKMFPFVLNVVGNYNKFMDSLTFMERR